MPRIRQEVVIFVLKIENLIGRRMEKRTPLIAATNLEVEIRR